MTTNKSFSAKNAGNSRNTSKNEGHRHLKPVETGFMILTLTCALDLMKKNWLNMLLLLSLSAHIIHYSNSECQCKID